MADNARTVQLDVAVSTSGAESIKALALDVRDLAKNGGDAAPEFQRLAAELDRIAKQADAVEAFSKLSADTAELSAAQATAAERTAALKSELDGLAATTRTYADVEAKARSGLAEDKAALTAKGDELKRLKLDYDTAGKATAEYKDRSKELNVAILDGTIALRASKEAVATAAANTEAAQVAEDKLAAAYKAASRESDAANKQLADRNATLAKSKAELEAAGIATDDLAAAQAKLISAFNSTQREAQQLQADVVNLARSEKELAEINAFEQQANEAKRLQAAAEYVQFWTEALKQNEVQARALQDTAVFEKQIAEAARLNAAADYVNFWTAALEKAEAEEKQLAETSARAAKALEDAFATTGIRSANAIREEINQIGASLVRVQQDAKTTGNDFDRAFASATQRIEKLKLELNGVSPAIVKSANSTSLLTEGLRNLTAVYGGLQLADSFITANTQLESLRRTLTIVTGSTEAAAKQIQFLRKTADESGVAIGSVSQAYSKFVASAKSAGISMEVVDRTFAAVTKASGLLGLSSEDTASALSALGQSASKGKVSLEELQQQLGDRLPAVLATTAKGLGITTAELVKLIENGQLLADNTYFSAFASGIEQTFIKGQTSVEGFQASLGRLKNTFNDTFTQIGEAGVMEALTATLQLIGQIVPPITSTFVEFGKALGTTAAVVVDLGAKLLTLDFKGLSSGIKQARDELTGLTSDFLQKNPAVIGLLNSLGVEGRAVATSMQLVADHSKTATTVVTGAGAAASGAAAAHNTLAAGTDAAGTAAGAAIDKWVQLTVAYGKQIAAAKLAAEASAKNVEGAKAEGAALTALAAIAGDETQVREVAYAVSLKTAEALRAEASATESISDLTRIKIGALEEEARATGTLSEARLKDLEAMRLKLPALEAEAAKSKAVADAAEIETLAKRKLIETYGDQSSSLGTLTALYEVAKIAVQSAVAAEAAGNGTHEQTTKALRDLALAEGKYHDALDDTTAALERKVARIRLDQSLTEATLNLQLQQARASEQMAILDGNEEAARAARISTKRIEISILEAKIVASKLEAQAIIATAEAYKVELEAMDKLTPAKKLEIEASIQNAKVKMLEADASGEMLKVLQKQIDNLIIYGDEAGKSRGKAGKAARDEAGDIDFNTAAQNRNADAINRVASASGSIDRNNKRNTSTPNDAKNVIGSGSGFGSLGAGPDVSVGDGQRFDKEAYDQAVSTWFHLYGGMTSSFGRPPPPDPNNYVVTNTSTGGSARAPVAGNGTNAGTSLFGPAPAPAPTSTSGNRTITINLAGVSTKINVASDLDANALTALIKQLTDAASRSGG